MKRPKQRTAAEYDKLPPKNNWTPEVKKGTASIIVSEDDPPLLLHHFVVGVVDAVKAYGQYGQLIKQYEMACKVINYGLVDNRVVVPHKKLGGQGLQLLNREMLQSCVENLCNNFSEDDTEKHYQGDGAEPPEISHDGTVGGINSHAFTDGTVRAAEHLHKFHLYNMKTQKQEGLHLASDEVRSKEVLNNIYSLFSTFSLHLTAYL
jgi:hypothetical protein